MTQGIERSFIAEKLSDVNQKVPEQGVKFQGVAVDVAEIIFQLQQVVQDHAPLDAPLQRGLLVMPEVHSRPLLQEGE